MLTSDLNGQRREGSYLQELLLVSDTRGDMAFHFRNGARALRILSTDDLLAMISRSTELLEDGRNPNPALLQQERATLLQAAGFLPPSYDERVQAAMSPPETAAATPTHDTALLLRRIARSGPAGGPR